MSNLYKVGGALHLDAPSYIRRQADQDLYEGLLAGEFCYVLNSRQMGKSSLRVQTMRRLQEAEVTCASIDITKVGSQGIIPEEWYAGVMFTLINQLELPLTLQEFEEWWEEYQLLSPVNRFTEFIDCVLLEETAGRIVIFIDEIDSVLQLTFKDDFFAAIRACYNKRAENPEYDRLTFAMLGVATPSNLIQDKNRTPFNIGQAIQLNGFQFEEARSLAQGLASKAENPESVLQVILKWTGGQPFLTQKLCHLVLVSNFSISEGEEASWIEQLVRSRIVENWEFQDEPEHLRTIRERLLKDEQRAGRLLGFYQQILQKGEVDADSTPEQIELKLSGLAIVQQSKLIIFSPIYRLIFNQTWVDQQIEALRPYSEAIKAWIASDRQDISRLLRGRALQDALAWATGKSLTDEDYHFFAASQDMHKQEIQIALEAEKKARTEVMQVLKQIAEGPHSNTRALLPSSLQQSLAQAPRGFTWSGPKIAAFITLGITSLILGLRQVGGFQPLELRAFDQMALLSPDRESDPRLLVVAITEADIHQQNRWPLSDKVVARLLEKLNQNQPRVIGLLLYRDVPQPPGHAALLKQLQSSNVVTIMLLGDTDSGTIPPPPRVSNEQVGFSDFVVDPDGVVRRNLLFANTKTEQYYSFALRLSLKYLAKENLSFQFKPDCLQIGNTVFPALNKYDGGYSALDDRGYQVLLNNRSANDIARQVTLTQVLNGEVKPEWVRDKLVLIGTTALSAKDLFLTPYNLSAQKDPKVPGVLIHAHMASQILDAASGKRSLFWFWPQWLEILWIAGWSVVGGCLAWYIRYRIVLLTSGVLALIVLLGVCFGIFLFQGWIPVVVPAITLLLSETTVVIYKNIREKQISQLIRVINLKNADP